MVTRGCWDKDLVIRVRRTVQLQPNTRGFSYVLWLPPALQKKKTLLSWDQTQKNRKNCTRGICI